MAGFDLLPELIKPGQSKALSSLKGQALIESLFNFRHRAAMAGSNPHITDRANDSKLDWGGGSVNRDFVM